jgi:hypothetical protein
MVLGFKKQFVEPILQGTKIHTIRLDLGGRWKEGNSIQFATGVRTSNYNEFKTGVCFSVQEIEISWVSNGDGQHPVPIMEVEVDGKILNWEEKVELAKNDGFPNIEEFAEWDAWNKVDFIGKIIHWTEKKY